jgi:hypothetical protein
MLDGRLFVGGTVNHRHEEETTASSGYFVGAID